MGSKISATLNLVGLLGGLTAAAYVMSNGLPDLSSAPSSSETPKQSGGHLPKFKIETQRWHDQRNAEGTVLRIWSLNEGQSVLIKNVIVNEDQGCTNNTEALEAKKKEYSTLPPDFWPPVTIPTKTMNYGEQWNVTLFKKCTPLKVTIETDRGDVRYYMEN